MKAVRLCEAVGADRAALVISANLVEAVLEMGDIDTAISSGQELAARLRDTYHTDILGYVLGMVSGALSLRGDADGALTAARDAVPHRKSAAAAEYPAGILRIRSEPGRRRRS